MYVLAKSVLALMIGFIASVVLGLVFIPWLRKLKVGQKTSVFVKAHEKKSGTPTMGVVMRYEAGRKNRRVGKKLTLCEQRGELFSWGEALSAER